MHAPKDAEHIVVAKLQIVFLTHPLHPPPHLGRGHEKVQHRLLGRVLERSGLLDVITQNLSHAENARLGVFFLCYNTQLARRTFRSDSSRPLAVGPHRARGLLNHLRDEEVFGVGLRGGF